MGGISHKLIGDKLLLDIEQTFQHRSHNPKSTTLIVVSDQMWIKELAPKRQVFKKRLNYMLKKYATHFRLNSTHN